MPAIFLFGSDGRHNARRFSRFQDADNLIRFGRFEIRLHKLIPPAIRRIQNRCAPFLGSIDDPVVKLCGNFAQDIPADRVHISIRAEETYDALLLLKRLDKSVQEDTVETSILKSDVILVVLVESVHGLPPFSCGKPKDKSGRFYEPFSCRIIINSISGTARWITPSPSTSSLGVCQNTRNTTWPHNFGGP